MGRSAWGEGKPSAGETRSTKPRPTNSTALLLVLSGLIVLAAGAVVFVAWPEARLRLFAAVPVGVGFGLLAWRLRFLAASGAVAGGLLAASVVGLGGWAWAAPSFAFFFLSSLLSKAGARRKAAAQAALHDKGHVRDAGQVYANGGVGWALLVAHAFVPSDLLYAGFLGAFAAAAADTWATEVGMLGRGRPRLLLTGRPAPPGTSGAVSGVGTLGALAGAAVVWLCALPFAGAWAATGGAAVAVVGGGVLAAFVDSLAGATVQARYRDPATGAETERAATAGVPHALVRGRRWMDNDRVNLLATAFGAAFAMACMRALDLGS